MLATTDGWFAEDAEPFTTLRHVTWGIKQGGSR